MDWRRRWAAIGALLFAGVALLLASRGATADTPESPIVEVERWLPAAPGAMKRVTILVDTREANPEAVADIAYPDALQPAAVTAQYATFAKWAPQDVPVPVGYDSTFDPPGIMGAAPLTVAMATWNGVPAQTFRFSAGGAIGAETPTCQVNDGDGANTVLFSGELLPGVLGETCTFFFGSVDGMERIVEFDLQLSSTTPWSTDPVTPSNAFDLETVVLHELGHAFGLDHAAQGTVMQTFLDPGTQLRAPTEDDVEGMRFLYGTGETPTPTLTTTSTASPTPTATTTATPTPSPTPVPTYQVTIGALARD